MKFKVGDKAVYPAHGVAVVKGLECRDVAGHPVSFYILQIISSGATLLVPVDSSERVGMRDVLSEGEIDNVFSILKQPGRVSTRTWNKRFREFNDKIRSGSVLDVAEVLRDLWTLQTKKELSFGEKKMLERSRSLLAAEISAARSEVSVDDADHQIVSVLQH